MFTTLRNIAIATVVLLLLFNTVGSVILLKLQDIALEERFETDLHNGKIQSNLIVKFTATDIVNAHWENDHEIKLNGRYYDLVRTSAASGIVTYYFIADEEETKLYAYYNSLQKHSKTKPLAFFPFAVYYHSPDMADRFFNTILQTISTGSTTLHDQSRNLPLFQPPRA